MIKVAVPHRFKLKVVPDFRTFFFPDRREIHYIPLILRKRQKP